MVSPAFIVNWILNELEARQAQIIEIQMICTTNTLNYQSVGSQVVERLQPGLEYRPDSFVTLKIDTPDFTGPIVEVEVAGELTVFGF